MRRVPNRFISEGDGYLIEAYGDALKLQMGTL